MTQQECLAGRFYRHQTFGRVCVVAVHEDLCLATVRPLRGPALVVKIAMLESDAVVLPESVRPRDCYRSFEVRMKFGMRNEKGELVPLSRITLYRWRKEGIISWVQHNSRCVLYPKAAVDELLRVRGRVLH